MGGAAALRMQDKIGSLTPGKKADIVFLRAQDLNLWPVHDPVFAIVEQAHAGNVDTVIVDGITRKSGGRLQVDAAFLSRLRTELQASASRLIGEWEERRAK
jgi:5-methylthioadenosine/S-adenosylhomocysteine deaminase